MQSMSDAVMSVRPYSLKEKCTFSFDPLLPVLGYEVKIHFSALLLQDKLQKKKKGCNVGNNLGESRGAISDENAGAPMRDIKERMREERQLLIQWPAPPW